MKLNSAIAAVAVCLANAPALAQSGDDPLAPILACRGIEDDLARLECFDQAAASLGGEVEAGEVVAVNREDVEAVERDSFGLDLPNLPRLSTSMFSRRPNEAVSDVDVSRSQPSNTTGGASAGVASESDESGVTSPQSSQTRGNTAREENLMERTGVRVVERSDDGMAEVVIMNVQRIDEFDYHRSRFYMANGQVWEQTRTADIRVPRNGEIRAEIRRTRMGIHLLKINGRGRSVQVRRIR